VLSNYFNFNIVSLEINDEAQRLGLKFGAANAYTNEKCRIRWFYIHCNRIISDKKKQYEERKEESKASHDNKENKGSENDCTIGTKPFNPSRLLGKDFKEDDNVQKSKANPAPVLKFSTVKIEPKKFVREEEKAVPLDSVPLNTFSILTPSSQTDGAQQSAEETKKDKAKAE